MNDAGFGDATSSYTYAPTSNNNENTIGASGGSYTYAHATSNNENTIGASGGSYTYAHATPVFDNTQTTPAQSTTTGTLLGTPDVNYNQTNTNNLTAEYGQIDYAGLFKNINEQGSSYIPTEHEAEYLKSIALNYRSQAEDSDPVFNNSLKDAELVSQMGGDNTWDLNTMFADNTSLTYSYQLVDEDGNPLPDSTPDWLTLEGSELKASPEDLDIGDYNIKLTATDEDGNQTSETIQYKVEDSIGLTDKQQDNAKPVINEVLHEGISWKHGEYPGDTDDFGKPIDPEHHAEWVASKLNKDEFETPVFLKNIIDLAHNADLLSNSDMGTYIRNLPRLMANDDSAIGNLLSYFGLDTPKYGSSIDDAKEAYKMLVDASGVKELHADTFGGFGAGYFKDVSVLEIDDKKYYEIQPEYNYVNNEGVIESTVKFFDGYQAILFKDEDGNVTDYRIRLDNGDDKIDAYESFDLSDIGTLTEGADRVSQEYIILKGLANMLETDSGHARLRELFNQSGVEALVALDKDLRSRQFNSVIGDKDDLPASEDSYVPEIVSLIWDVFTEENSPSKTMDDALDISSSIENLQLLGEWQSSTADYKQDVFNIVRKENLIDDDVWGFSIHQSDNTLVIGEDVFVDSLSFNDIKKGIIDKAILVDDKGNDVAEYRFDKNTDGYVIEIAGKVYPVSSSEDYNQSINSELRLNYQKEHLEDNPELSKKLEDNRLEKVRILEAMKEMANGLNPLEGEGLMNKMDYSNKLNELEANKADILKEIEDWNYDKGVDEREFSGTKSNLDFRNAGSGFIDDDSFILGKEALEERNNKNEEDGVDVIVDAVEEANKTVVAATTIAGLSANNYAIETKVLGDSIDKKNLEDYNNRQAEIEAGKYTSYHQNQGDKPTSINIDGTTNTDISPSSPRLTKAEYTELKDLISSTVSDSIKHGKIDPNDVSLIEDFRHLNNPDTNINEVSLDKKLLERLGLPEDTRLVNELPSNGAPSNANVVTLNNINNLINQEIAKGVGLSHDSNSIVAAIQNAYFEKNGSTLMDRIGLNENPLEKQPNPNSITLNDLEKTTTDTIAKGVSLNHDIDSMVDAIHKNYPDLDKHAIKLDIENAIQEAKIQEARSIIQNFSTPEALILESVTIPTDFEKPIQTAAAMNVRSTKDTDKDDGKTDGKTDDNKPTFKKKGKEDKTIKGNLSISDEDAKKLGLPKGTVVVPQADFDRKFNNDLTESKVINNTVKIVSAGTPLNTMLEGLKETVSGSINSRQKAYAYNDELEDKKLEFFKEQNQINKDLKEATDNGDSDKIKALEKDLATNKQYLKEINKEINTSGKQQQKGWDPIQQELNLAQKTISKEIDSVKGQISDIPAEKRIETNLEYTALRHEIQQLKDHSGELKKAIRSIDDNKKVTTNGVHISEKEFNKAVITQTATEMRENNPALNNISTTVEVSPDSNFSDGPSIDPDTSKDPLYTLSPEAQKAMDDYRNDSPKTTFDAVETKVKNTIKQTADNLKEDIKNNNLSSPVDALGNPSGGDIKNTVVGEKPNPLPKIVDAAKDLTGSVVGGFYNSVPGKALVSIDNAMDKSIMGLLGEKIGSKAIPVVGWAALAYDVYEGGKYLIEELDQLGQKSTYDPMMANYLKQTSELSNGELINSLQASNIVSHNSETSFNQIDNRNYLALLGTSMHVKALIEQGMFNHDDHKYLTDLYTQKMLVEKAALGYQSDHDKVSDMLENDLGLVDVEGKVFGLWGVDSDIDNLNKLKEVATADQIYSLLVANDWSDFEKGKLRNILEDKLFQEDIQSYLAKTGDISFDMHAEAAEEAGWIERHGDSSILDKNLIEQNANSIDIQSMLNDSFETNEDRIWLENLLKIKIEEEDSLGSMSTVDIATKMINDHNSEQQQITEKLKEEYEHNKELLKIKQEKLDSIHGRGQSVGGVKRSISNDIKKLEVQISAYESLSDSGAKNYEQTVIESRNKTTNDLWDEAKSLGFVDDLWGYWRNDVVNLDLIAKQATSAHIQAIISQKDLSESDNKELHKILAVVTQKENSIILANLSGDIDPDDTPPSPPTGGGAIDKASAKSSESTPNTEPKQEEGASIVDSAKEIVTDAVLGKKAYGNDDNPVNLVKEGGWDKFKPKEDESSIVSEENQKTETSNPVNSDFLSKIAERKAQEQSGVEDNTVETQKLDPIDDANTDDFGNPLSTNDFGEDVPYFENAEIRAEQMNRNNDININDPDEIIDTDPNSTTDFEGNRQ